MSYNELQWVISPCGGSNPIASTYQTFHELLMTTGSGGESLCRRIRRSDNDQTSVRDWSRGVLGLHCDLRVRRNLALDEAHKRYFADPELTHIVRKPWDGHESSSQLYDMITKRLELRR